MVGGPLQEPRQVGPVRLEAQVNLRRLRSSDDQGVRRLRPQLVESAVALLDESGDLLRARNLLDRVELELDPGPVRCRSAAPRNWFSVSRNAESGMLLTRPTVSGRGPVQTSRTVMYVSPKPIWPTYGRRRRLGPSAGNSAPLLLERVASTISSVPAVTVADFPRRRAGKIGREA